MDTKRGRDWRRRSQDPQDRALDEALYRRERHLQPRNTPISFQRVKQMYKEKIPIKEAANRLGYSASTVSRYYNQIKLLNYERRFCKLDFGRYRNYKDSLIFFSMSVAKRLKACKKIVESLEKQRKSK